ncbi:SufB/SufD family protein [Propionimicrobium lymphophilum]|uniref:SufB/SufD family protein n=1 Tax=Propionimicrobium lymphophilum TaxID=33012 RepID=UPI0004253F2A|nr:SufD family Fe-S cluster assembly protein [Propionimicrobium lymphophilum]
MLTNTAARFDALQQPKVKSHLHPTPSWQPSDHPVPSGREEVWRFTPLEKIEPLFDDKAECFTDWKFELPEGVTSKSITQEEAQERSFDAPVDIVASVAGHTPKATLIEIAPETVISEPLILDLSGERGRINTQLFLEIGHHAQATIVLRHTGKAQLAAKIETIVGDGAKVNFVSLQDWDEGSLHGGQVSTLVGRDAEVKLIQASIGGSLIRQVERAMFSGPGGRIEQFGLYFVDANRNVEHRIFIDHNAPNTYSHADYRGALQGKGARSVWIGDVLIRSAAKNIETYETNQNLVLTEGCQADSVPNLEIETGEILGAGHSSSTGRFDEDHLFYLRSRGIPEDQARRLIVEGFFLDLIHHIDIPEIEDRLVEALNHELLAVEGISDKLN